MLHFDPKHLIPYLEKKGWTASYSLDYMHYWNCVWEDAVFLYVIEVHVFPYTKITNLKSKIRGYVVTKESGEIYHAPHFEFQLDADEVRTYQDIRMWISYLMEK
jgi:hypothetical protein